MAIAPRRSPGGTITARLVTITLIALLVMPMVMLPRPVETSQLPEVDAGRD